MALFSLGRGKSVQVGVTICCLVAFVLFGYDQGVLGGILENEDWQRQFGYPNDTETGIIVSCYNLGCLTGCVINFFLGDKLGRRRTIWLAMGFVLVGATLQASAYSVAHLVIGRVITGFGTGIKTSTVPMYQSELCSPGARGRLVSTEVLFVGVGITIAYWFDFGMSFVGGEGHDEEAINVLCQFHDKGPSDPSILAETSSIQKAIELELSSNKGDSFFSIFKKDSIGTRYRILLAWGVQFMNQAGGINLVVYYIPSVLVQNVGMDKRTAQILGGCINMMFMFGLGVCMLMVAALLSQVGHPNGHACASAAVAFFFLYMLIFGMSVNCVPWVYVPEILPLEARTRGTAIGVSSNWLWNFTVVMITPVIINRLQWKAYLIFMVTNLLFVPTFYFFYPETSNFSLEDIDLVFSQGGNPVSIARQMSKNVKLTVPSDSGTSTGTGKEQSLMVEQV
uniref:Major facilitator superfamily (MFS) profile domain-containing protein n=1 Tax=Bionectria ochroleuca TaxID=29856 RepID=A0A8H7K4U4_BIOOC